MVFYLSMFFLNMLLGITIKYTNLIGKREKRDKIYLIITCIQLTLIAGLRASSVGWDTANYIEYYNMVARSSSIVGLIRRTISWIEPGYFVMCYIVKLFGGNAQISFIIASIIMYGPILNFIYRYSNNKIMSVLTIFCFPVFYDSLSLMRNAIVCAIFVWSMRYIEEKKLIKYLICTAIASSFHNIALLFIPLYFVQFIKWKKWYNAFLVIIAALLVYSQMMNIVSGLAGFMSDYASLYGFGRTFWFGTASGGLKTAIMYSVIVMFAYYLYSTYRRGGKKQDLLAGYALILPAAAFCYMTAAMFIRIMLMIMPIAGVFITNEIELIPNLENRRIFRLGMAVLLIAFQIFTLWVNAENYIPYIPFWRS